MVALTVSGWPLTPLAGWRPASTHGETFSMSTRGLGMIGCSLGLSCSRRGGACAIVDPRDLQLGWWSDSFALPVPPHADSRCGCWRGTQHHLRRTGETAARQGSAAAENAPQALRCTAELLLLAATSA